MLRPGRRPLQAGYCMLCQRSFDAPSTQGYQMDNGDFHCIVCWELEYLATSIRARTRSMGPVARQIAAGRILQARITLNLELRQLQQDELEAHDDYMQHQPNAEDDWGYY